MSAPNPYHSVRNVASIPGQSDRALVVNIQDPLKAGRVQIRVVGKMDDEIGVPDEKLPWVKVMNGTSTASLQTSTTTHGLLPGSMVSVEAYGEGGQDYIIKGTIPNDRKDDQQTIHPATQGKDATDNMFPHNEYEDKMQGWSMPIGELVKSKTSKMARQIRDNTDRKKKRTKSPEKISQDESKVPKHYGQRATSKDPKGGTIGTFKFSGKDAQQFIQNAVQNKSAIVPNALSALQSLKKVTSNPSSIDSIGASNFSSILSQLSQWFKSNGGKEEQQKYDCEYLINAAEELLSEELKQARDLCLLVEQMKNENTNVG